MHVFLNYRAKQHGFARAHRPELLPSVSALGYILSAKISAEG